MKICGCTLRLRCSQVVPAFWAPMPMKSGDNGILPWALGDLVLGATGTYDGGLGRAFQAGRVSAGDADDREVRTGSEPRTQVVKALRQPFEKSAEVLPLPGEGVPLWRLVPAPAHKVELGGIGRLEREQDFGVASSFVELHPQAVFAELAVSPVASSVGGEHDRPGGHRFEAGEVETLLDQGGGEEDVGPVVEFAQLLPAHGVPDRAELERRVSYPFGHPVAHVGLPGSVGYPDPRPEPSGPFSGEERGVVAQVYDLCHGRLVQVGPDCFEDHVVRHD